MTIDFKGVTLKSVTVGAPPAPVDPYYSSVELLYHMDGANNSTVCVDSSKNNYTITTSDNAVISTEQSVYGGSSGKFTATTSARFKSPTTTNLAITGAFTMEAWWRPTVVSNGIYPISCVGSSLMWITLGGPNSALEFYFLGNQLTSTFVPVVDTWYFLTVTRDSSNNVRNFVNGNQVTSSYVNNISMASTAYWSVGSSPELAGGSAGGRCFVDEFRFTKGVARYTDNFTPPSQPFPNS